MSVLLQRGHGSILSGFFIVFSSEALVSLCSSFLEGSGELGSFSTDGVSGLPHGVFGSFNSSSGLVSVSSLSEGF